MEYYQLLKSIHITTAILSVSLFILRYLLTLGYSEKRHNLVLKIAPHINDSLLLIAGALMVYWGPYSPIAMPSEFLWLIGKWLLLLLYISAGIFALRRAKTKQGKITAMLVALASVTTIFCLAIFKPV